MFIRGIKNEVAGHLIAAIVLAAAAIGYDQQSSMPLTQTKAPTSNTVVVTQTAAASADEDEDDGDAEAAPIVPVVAEAKPLPGSTVGITVMTFTQSAEKKFAVDAQQFGIRLPDSDPNFHLASLGKPQVLPIITVKPQVPKPEVWTATLDERQDIARNFLARVCPKILPLEKMQSAATLAQTNARFMRAKNAGQVIGSVKAELRGHSNVVWAMCPANFYASLFKQK